MRTAAVVVSLAVLSFLTLQCSEKTLGPAPAPEPDPNLPVVRTPADLTDQEKSVLNSCNKFGFNLFREIVATTPNTDNVFISPLSVSYALGLCYNGAEGETREAIGTTLEMAGLSLLELNQAYHDLTEILVQADPEVDFRVANSFWSRTGKSIQPGYIDLARTYFDARIEEIDFTAPGAADTINAWVARATNDKITDMVESPISGDVAAMLFNAIYFKGNWMFPFDTADTQTLPFLLADGGETECAMMSLSEADCLMQLPGVQYPQTDSNVVYYHDSDVNVLSMPYGGGDYRMSIVMPHISYGQGGGHDHTIDEVIAGMTEEKWALWSGGSTPFQFYLGLPRFKFEYEVSLNEALKALGMEIAFDGSRADFSNMFVDGVGWIDEAKQKTFIQVDEIGTEAAAVTQVVFIDSAPAPLICDRPFLIVIWEDVSGAILFMGRIANPVWEDS